MKRVVSFLLVLVFPLAGCGTLFNKDIKHLPVDSDPQGADIYIEGNRIGTTPDTIRINNNKSHTIVLRMEDRKEATCEVKSSAKAGWIILDVLLGVVGIVVDAVTGEWSGIGAQGCSATLPPAAAQDATAIQ